MALRPVQTSTARLHMASYNRALHSPLVKEIFTKQHFVGDHEPQGFLALQDMPIADFAPYRINNRIEVLCVKDPHKLPAPLAEDLASRWQGGLGLILFRDISVNTLGAIFVHSAVRCPWSLIEPNAWQALGGVMSFEKMGVEHALGTVVDKAVAMTYKWRHIDRSLEATGHDQLTHLGGAKAVILHAPGIREKYDAILATAAVARSLGIYISGADQNMSSVQCSSFATHAPLNFAGSSQSAEAYRGTQDASPYTAHGVMAGLNAMTLVIFGGEKPRLFLQGCGKVGNVLLRQALKDGFPIAGIAETSGSQLRAAYNLLKAAGVKAPLYLVGEPNSEEKSKLVNPDGEIVPFKVVPDLSAALAGSPETEVLSLNAGAHPITQEVAEYLITSKVKAVLPAANNTFDFVNGSEEPLASLLQTHRIFVPNDAMLNRMGATAVIKTAIGLDDDGIATQIAQIGYDVVEEYQQAFLSGTAPQLWSRRRAEAAWKSLLESGLAVGGKSEI